MGDRRPKLLIIGHSANRNGAPLSLLEILRFLNSTGDFETRLVLRKGGPLKPSYLKSARTYQYREASVADRVRRASIRLSKIFPRAVVNWLHGPLTQYARLLARLFDGFLRIRISRWRPDIVYANTILNGDVLQRLDLTAPVICHVRELGTTFSLLNPVQLAVFQERVQRYLAVSSAVEIYLRGEKLIPNARISHLSVGIDAQELQRKASDPTNATELDPSNTPLLGAVGSADSRKGVDRFLEIARAMLELDPACAKFVWIGDGPLLAQMKTLVEKAQLTWAISFVGSKPNPYPWMRQFSLHLSFSREDPFPRTVVEAALLGCPSVAFRGAGGAEEFLNGRHGLLLKGEDVKDDAQSLLTYLRDWPSLCLTGERVRRKALEENSINIIGPRLTKILFDELRCVPTRP